MLNQNFQGVMLPALGVGAMRLPVKGADDADIDEAEIARMLAFAMEHGVNYFDTGYDYHGGRSEAVVGRLLGAYPRDSYYLAAKFPGYDAANLDKVEEIFERQLQRCGVTHFDFYLFHNVYEKNVGPYLDERYGILSYLLKQRASGRIRHLGFSCHGSYEVMKRFLDACGAQMEFGQIQLNYLDWNFQDAKAKVELLNKRGIPIFVMEPLRGGRLASLPDEAAARLKTLRPEESVPGWAFRFLQTVPGVAMVLSGMSNLEQLKANVKTFQTRQPLNDEEFQAIVSIADAMVAQGILPCTACRYCVSHCPKGLNIPYLLSLYNEHSFTGGGFIAPMAVSALPEDKRPNACVGCRGCEAVCPQQLHIADTMAAFSGQLGLH